MIQREPYRRHPHPVPRSQAAALRLLLPVRGGSRGGQKADPLLLQPGSRQDGRPHRQPAHPRGPQDRPGAAALQPLRRLPGPLPADLPGRCRRPGLHRPDRHGQAPGSRPPDQGDQSAAPGLRPRLRARMRSGLPPQPRRRARGHRLPEALRHGYRYRGPLDPRRSCRQRQESGRGGRRAGRPDLRLLPGAEGLRRHPV